MLTNTKPAIKHNKINLSISHLLNPKPHHIKAPTDEEQPISDILLTPLRFEEMYRLMSTKMKKKPIIFDSKNVTPVQSRHHSRNASLKKSKKSYSSNRYHEKLKQQQNNPKIYDTTNEIKPYEQDTTKNINPITFTHEINASTPPQFDPMKTPIAQKREKFCQKLEQLLKETNHHKHNHIRNKECFLGADQIKDVIGKMGYSTKSGKYQDFLEQLQCEKYDGVPSDNIRSYLLIIQGIDGKQIRLSHHQQSQMNILPKSIINRSLEIFITDHEKQWIFQYFRTWSLFSTSSISPQIQSTLYHPPPVKHLQETNPEPQIENCQLDTFTQTSNILQELKNNKQNSINNFEDENEKHKEILKLKSKINEALEFSRSLMETKENITTTDSIEKQKKPILSVNVNLGNNLSENIVVYEGQSPKQVCERLSSKFRLSEQTKNKFQKMLSNHLKNMLWKISELSEELLTENQ